jgi:hypothetical protein
MIRQLIESGRAEGTFIERRYPPLAQKIGRSAKPGRFTTVKLAKQHPSTHVVETIKK